MSVFELLVVYLFILGTVTVFSLSLIRWLRRRHWSRRELTAGDQPPSELQSERAWLWPTRLFKLWSKFHNLWLARPRSTRIGPADSPLRMEQAKDERLPWWNSVWVGLAALGIGLGAQYTLAHKSPLLGAGGYLVATLLFVVAMRPFLAQDWPLETSLPERVGVRKIKPVEPPVPPPGSELTLDKRVALFRQHWQLFTLADVLAGFRLPEAVLTPEGEPLVDVSLPVVAKVEEEAVSAVARPPVVVPLKPAVVAAWTGDESFTPQALVTTPQGDLLALDVGQNVIYRFGPGGELLERWSVPDLPPLYSHNLTVSSDGKTLYIADSANHCVRVIALADA